MALMDITTFTHPAKFNTDEASFGESDPQRLKNALGVDRSLKLGKLPAIAGIAQLVEQLICNQ